jgi:preprotein translocase subunit SecA
MSSALLRPGIARGAYPERTLARRGPVERALALAAGGLERHRHARLARLHAFARAVDALGPELERASDVGLSRHVTGLRSELALAGLTEELTVRAFALVRELARRTLGARPYEVQLMGAFALSRGMLAEMNTGEGKTLTASLPAAAAALAGIPVHVISVNDYLVERDARELGPLYRALGLSVGTVVERERDPDARRSAYGADITYVSCKQVAFDYLRDRIARSREGDPASRIEAMRSGRPERSPPLLRGLCYAIVDEADSVLIDEARTPLILSAPQTSGQEERAYRSALRIAGALREGEHFRMDRKLRRTELTPGGRERVAELAKPLGGAFAAARWREERISRALSALHVFERDRDYLVREGKVQIVDPSTGRAAPDRSWERGLHQLIELREGCPLTPENQVLARVSYQRFFRRYLRLSGMSGTAREVRRELFAIYGLHTVRIPPRRPVQRRALGTRVYRSREAKWRATLTRARAEHARGRPVLIGTCSVAESEALAKRLREAGLEPQVLNARQDAEEAAIEPGRITVATQMAGRGTDIRLAPGVAERGGLHVIATDRAEAARIDRQLEGRSGRQGDPGSCEAILSLEDSAARLYHGALVRRLLSRGQPSAPLPGWLGRVLMRLPQRADERAHARMRRELIEFEEFMSELLAFSGATE